MRLVHLARLYYPHVGGVEKHLQKINEQFLKIGHSVTVITQRYDLNLPESETLNNVNIVRLTSMTKIVGIKQKTLFKLKTWWHIFKNLNILFQADIIHVHDVMWWLIPFYPFLWKKIYITFHGYEGNQEPNGRQFFWHILASKLSRGNICVGGFHAKWYKIKPTITTFGAVEALDQKNNKKFAKNKNSIIFIGRLSADNGILNYLEALKILKNKGHDFSLDVYGDGPLLKKAQKYVKKHGLKVVFHGFVANAQQFLPKYNLAFVSRYLVILEAFSAKVKVIAQYNNQIKKDYLELSPFNKWLDIVSSGNEIAEAVLENKSSNKAKNWVDKQTWTKMANTYLKLWNNN